MKVELQGAKVELEVGEGKSNLVINGEVIPLPREAGVRLIFGESKVEKVGEKPTTATPLLKGSVVKAVQRKTGAQSRASRKKLSESLLRFHANRRRREKLAEGKKGAPVVASKKPANGKLNGKLNGIQLPN